MNCYHKKLLSFKKNYPLNLIHRYLIFKYIKFIEIKDKIADKLGRFTYMTLGLKINNCYNTDLSFPIDPDDTRSCLMGSSHKYCIPADSVHVDTSSCFYVIQMNVSILGYQIYHVIFRTNLNRNSQNNNKIMNNS